MNETMGRLAQNDRSGLAAPMLITALVALIAIGRTEAVLAQNNPPPPLSSPQAADPRPPMSQDRMEAPIGHRQPRPQDLPPSVQREEGQRTPAERQLDEKLQICRGC
jgi:cell division protein FtsN